MIEAEEMNAFLESHLIFLKVELLTLKAFVKMHANIMQEKSKSKKIKI
jgi:hypothetical protein